MRASDRQSTEGLSAAELPLDPYEEKDLERYLDVTRGEILFAKGILLVEGDSEIFLLPVLARLNGIDFDELGITVCSVSGTNFLPYVKLLGPRGLRLPFAVVTDGDPGAKEKAGEKRILELLPHAIEESSKLEGKGKRDRLALAGKHGLFLGDHTFEVDLFRAGRHKSMCKTLVELSDNSAARARAERWRDVPHELDAEQLLKDIGEIGKGRYAQRLATRIKKTIWPPYVRDAVNHVAKRCQ